MKKLVPILLVFLIVGGIIAFNLYNKSHVETSSTKADFTVSPTDLLAAYEQNEVKADQMYLDKIIEVSGTVKSINEVNTGSSISLDTGNEMAAVTCEFEKSDAIGAIKIGDIVTVKGFCSGKLMDIVLTRCSM